MNTIEVICDQFSWHEKIKNFNTIDVYYSYEYGLLFSKIEEGELIAAYMEKGDTKLFFPFIKRSVPFVKGKYYDIVTPYGYGGPHIEGEDSSIVDKFYNEFGRYCLNNDIITETIRCHPLTKNYWFLVNNIELQYIRKTTAVDLTRPLDEIQSNYTSMNRRNIQKAKKEGLVCYVAEPTDDNVQLFMNLYNETMDRNQASIYYYFDKNYFNDQMKETSLSKTYLLFTEYKNEVIAGVMVMIGNEYAHYHLGASRTEFLHKRPNNILFDHMIQFCKSKGSSLLHLGGGYEEGDGLFKFKTSFTNGNNFDYFIGKKIYNDDVYNKFAREVMSNYEVNEKYFPIYRAVLKPKVAKV